jgi:hypothetical protein
LLFNPENKVVEKYLSPVSGNSTTNGFSFIFRSFSNLCCGKTSAAPEEIP